MDPVLPLALLHTVLLHRRGYGSAAMTTHPNWSHTDLAASVEYLNMIAMLCQRHTGVPDVIAHVYGRHCTDPTDQAVTEALTEGLILSPNEMVQVCTHCEKETN